MRRVVAAAFVVLLILLNAPARGAAAGGVISQVGWWTRNPAAAAPEDGMNVGSAPDGPVSVGAVEITSSTGLSRAVLILAEEGGIQADSAKLAVCITPNEWTAGGAQPMAEAPKAECESNKVELARNASSSTWAADVTTLVGDLEDEGSVSLMIVPAGDATVPVGFEVRFKKPELSSEASASSSSSTDFSSDFSSDSGSSSDSSTSSGAFSSGTGSSSSGSSTFTPTFEASAPSAPVAPTTADGAAGAPAATAPVAETTATTAPAELAAVPTQAALGGGASGGSAVQAIFFVIIATIAGAGAGATRWFIRSRNPESTFA